MDSFIQWCQHLALGEAIRSVSWAYPSIEIIHIFGLVMIFGSVLIPNLRTFSVFLKDTPAAAVADDLAPWTLVGLCLQVVSGPLLFITSAERFSQSDPFRIKVVLLAVALIYHFAIHRNSTKGRGLLPAMVSATLSMLLWISVIVAGLSIELLA